MFRKMTDIYRTEGVRGLYQRLIDRYKSAKKRNRHKLHRFLLNKSSLYQNVCDLHRDVIFTKQIRSKISEKKLQSIDTLDIDRFKSSKRVFILASGASVNDLLPSDFDLIAESDSIGFNFWLVHNFVPTFYFIEPPVGEDDRWDIMLQLLDRKRNDYLNTPFVCEYKYWQFHEDAYPLTAFPKEIYQNLHFYAPYWLRLTKRTYVAAALWYWRIFKVRQHRFEDVIHHRATLSALIMFSLFAGYEEIVLVGVDLNDTAYFWEENDSYKIKPPNIQKGQVHLTADPTMNEVNKAIPIDVYIDLINRIILKPNGVSLYVASEKSRLYPGLAKFEFPK